MFYTVTNFEGHQVSLNPSQIESIQWGVRVADWGSENEEERLFTCITLASGRIVEVDHTDPANHKIFINLVGHDWANNLG